MAHSDHVTIASAEHAGRVAGAMRLFLAGRRAQLTRNEMMGGGGGRGRGPAHTDTARDSTGRIMHR